MIQATGGNSVSLLSRTDSFGPADWKEELTLDKQKDWRASPKCAGAAAPITRTNAIWAAWGTHSAPKHQATINREAKSVEVSQAPWVRAFCPTLHCDLSFSGRGGQAFLKSSVPGWWELLPWEGSASSKNYKRFLVWPPRTEKRKIKDVFLVWWPLSYLPWVVCAFTAWFSS